MNADIASHVAIIKLVIAYTLIGAFIFTVIATCLSLVGIVRFAKHSQQSKLFGVLVVELVIICVGVFANLLQVNPKETQRQVARPFGVATEAAKRQAKVSGVQLQTVALAGLKPEAADLAMKLVELAQSKGIELRVISGYRSPEQQADFFASRVAGVKISAHNTGLAFDVMVVEDGAEILDAEKYQLVGALGKSLGLVWGGDWKSVVDLAHFETKDAKEAVAKLRGV